MKATRVGIYLGLTLTLIGLLLPIVGFSVPSLLAVVVYDSTPPSIQGTNPSGSDTTPTPLTLGQSIVVSMAVVEANPDKATCDISSVAGSTYSTSLTLTYKTAYAGVKEYSTSWTVPSTLADGTKLKFYFKMTDIAGNVGDKTAYGLVGVPNGYFEINGIRADQTTVIGVKTPSLTFRFVATKGASSITMVYVAVYDSTGTKLSDVDLADVSGVKEIWSGSYVLPYEGKFTINGYFKDSTGISYQRLNLMLDWTSGPTFMIPTLSELFNIVTLLGVAIATISYAIEKTEEE